MRSPCWCWAWPGVRCWAGARACSPVDRCGGRCRRVDAASVRLRRVVWGRVRIPQKKFYGIRLEPLQEFGHPAIVSFLWCGVEQSGSSSGSYPEGLRFESYPRYHIYLTRSGDLHIGVAVFVFDGHRAAQQLAQGIASAGQVAGVVAQAVDNGAPRLTRPRQELGGLERLQRGQVALGLVDCPLGGE